jgi:pyridoxamine-phosphate oxidase
VSKPVETLSGDPTLELPEFDSPPAEPLALLERWLAAAETRGVREPRALSLATADGEGRPSVRTLLVKQLTPTLVFAGGYESRKGRDLAANPRAAATLYWRETLQQITIEGPVERLGDEEADRIFGERPAEAQAAAVTSRQGETLDDPEALRRAASSRSAEAGTFERPSRWGGWRLDPDLIEFWHGSPSRLHRRLLYVKGEDGWEHKRLQP